MIKLAPKLAPPANRPDTITLKRSPLMIRTLLLTLPAAVLCALVLPASASEATVSFGSGLNQFSMTFVPIGSPGNAPDTTGNPNPAGAVGYVYNLGKFEVSEDMITKFNASQSLTITKQTRGPNKPATGVSWNEAARFVNWLNTSTGGLPAYKFTTGGVNDNIALWTPADTLDYDAANVFRSKRATYVLPTSNEWYKAAYFNPATSTYSDFPNGLNTPPTAVASGTAANTAVYSQLSATGPADITKAGGLSPFGVMGLGGNIWEMEETEYDLVNDSASSGRGLRGSLWDDGPLNMSSSKRFILNPVSQPDATGFRVASVTPVPEPSTYAVVLTGLTVLRWTRWRRKGK